MCIRLNTSKDQTHIYIHALTELWCQTSTSHHIYRAPDVNLSIFILTILFHTICPTVSRCVYQSPFIPHNILELIRRVETVEVCRYCCLFLLGESLYFPNFFIETKKQNKKKMVNMYHDVVVRMTSGMHCNVVRATSHDDDDDVDDIL